MYSEVCVICAKSSMIWGCAHFAYLSLESNRREIISEQYQLNSKHLYRGIQSMPELVNAKSKTIFS